MNTKNIICLFSLLVVFGCAEKIKPSEWLLATYQNAKGQDLSCLMHVIIAPRLYERNDTLFLTRIDIGFKDTAIALSPDTNYSEYPKSIMLYAQLKGISLDSAKANWRMTYPKITSTYFAIGISEMFSLPRLGDFIAFCMDESSKTCLYYVPDTSKVWYESYKKKFVPRNQLCEQWYYIIDK